MYKFFVTVGGEVVNIDTLPPEKKKEIFVAANRKAAEVTGHIISDTEDKTA